MPPPKPLSRRDLFELISDEALRDGVVEPHENRILQKMAKFLRLSAEESTAIAKASIRRYQSGELGQSRALSPEALFQEAQRLVLDDGQVDEEEAVMLRALRHVLGLEPTAEVPVEPPSPGSTTPHLARALDQDPIQAWKAEHGVWLGPVQHCSPEVRQAWSSIRAGIQSQSLEVLTRGLETLEDALESHTVGLADIVLALRVLRLSRILLRTQPGTEPNHPVRAWPGSTLYARLMIRMGSILLSLSQFRPHPTSDEALGLAWVYLVEDLSELVRSSRTDALLALGPVLTQACRASQDLLPNHLSGEVFSLLAERAEGGSKQLRATLAKVYRDLCSALKPNHPLALRADAALPLLQGDGGFFPPGHKPPPSQPGRECGGEAVTRIRGLLEKLDREAALEQTFLEALSKASIPQVDAYFQALQDRAKDMQIPPESVLDQHLVALALPSLPGWPRPVLAFFSGSDQDSHRTEFRERVLSVSLRRDQEKARVQAEFPLAGITILQAESFDPKPLAQELNRSGGAYDVALVSLSRKTAQLWHQTGNLDPTGGIYEVEYNLLGQGDVEGAKRALAKTLERHPWNSLARIHLGLIAKRSGDLAQAKRCFQEALQAQPHDWLPRTRLGVLAKQDDQVSEALRWLYEAYRLNPTDESTALTFASLALQEAASGDSSKLPLYEYVMAGFSSWDPANPGFRAVLQNAEAIHSAYAVGIPTTEPDRGFAV